MESKFDPPLRFSPDNSDEMRARRIKAHQYTLARVVEVPHLYVLPAPEGVEDNVIHLPIRQEPPQLSA